MIEFRFNEKPYRITGDADAPPEQVLDLGLQFSTLTVVVRLLEIVETMTGPSVTFQLFTSLDLRDGKWFHLGDFSPLDKDDSYDKRDFTGLLRYVRWSASLTNASAVTFEIFGVAR